MKIEFYCKFIFYKSKVHIDCEIMKSSFNEFHLDPIKHFTTFYVIMTPISPHRAK